MRHILINGQFTDTVSVNDRSLNYGDGLFETIAIKSGQPCLWEQHIHRLQLGCERLKFPSLDQQLLTVEMNMLLHNCSTGILKILLTRGNNERGYKIPKNQIPTRILTFYPPPQYPSQWWQMGIKVHLCHTKLAINPMLAGIKHTNRLEQVLASSEWNDSEIAEGLMQDTNDNWISGTKTNLFLIQDKTLFTPLVYECGIAGIMRNFVIECALNQGINVIEKYINTQDLYQAQGMFLTNSLIGICPVRELNGITYKIFNWFNLQAESFSKTTCSYI